MTEIKVKERPEAPQREEGRRVVQVAEGILLQDPGVHARWAWADSESKRSRTRITNLKRFGYRAAKAEDVADMRDAYLETDGTIHKGDLMLMVCDRAAVEERDVAARRERESAERRQVKVIERPGGSGEPSIEIDQGLHRQRVRGKEVDLP